MKIPKLFFVLLFFPFTFVLDVVVFALTQSCTGCASFPVWISSRAALSFPVILLVTEAVHRKHL